MSHLALLMMLRKYRFLYLVIFVLAFCIWFYLLIPHIIKYESSTTFYHSNENLVNPTSFSQKGSRIINLHDPVQERLYQLTYSTELLQFLIQEFNLYRHYNIDSSTMYHYEKVISTLTSNITFQRNTGDLFTIFVMDRDSELAAKIANTLLLKLDELNKNYIIQKSQTNLNFYESFLRESEKLNEQQNKMIMLYVDKLKNSNGKENVSSPKTELEYTLYQAAASIEEVTTQLMIAKGLYSNAVLTQQSNELPSLTVIKKAYPNPKSKVLNLTAFAVLGALLICIIVLLIMYFFHTYEKDLQIIFGRTPTSL